MRAPGCLIATIAVSCFAGCAGPPSPPAAAPGKPEPAAKVLVAPQPSFASPDEAVAALYQAAVAKDLAAMARITGLPAQDVSSGDAEKDARQVQRFVQAHDQRVHLQAEGDARVRVFIGDDNYPLASPLVRAGDRWTFDSAGGRQELIDRRIGENELATIGVCRAYVQAQYEYYAEDRDGDDVLQFAPKLASSSGRRDGLYWLAADGEPASPLGSLIAAARATGYLSGSAQRLDEPRPYHGYLFRVLTAQGEHAPGGAYSYLLNGRMVAGFALVAYPARWGRSGVMTFLVGANGKVLQKNLGEATAELAAAIAAYDPDAGWALVQD